MAKRYNPIFFMISIHAPRGGSDPAHWRMRSTGQISIHAPRGGSDAENLIDRARRVIFQSTLPVGGATCLWDGILRNA